VCEECAEKDPVNVAEYFTDFGDEEGIAKWKKKVSNPAHTMSEFDREVAARLLNK